MVVLNKISLLQLCLDVARYVPGLLLGNRTLIEHCTRLLEQHETYIREHFDDLPEIKDWVWDQEDSAPC